MKRFTAFLALVVLAVGCATSSSVDNDALIRQTLNTMKEGIEQQDVDKIMTAYSENYSSSQAQGKEPVATFWGNAKDQGYLEGATAVLDSTTVTIDGDTATAGPVTLQGPAGGFDIRIDLAKESGGWLIVNTDEW